MKPNNKIVPNLFLAVVVTLCATEMSFSQPFKDDAIVPADFQNDAKGDNWNSDPEATDMPQKVTDVAMSFLDGDGDTSWMSQISSQFSNVDFPRVFGSLAIVLGGYLGFVWLTRRFGSQSTSNGRLPQEVVEVLGQSSYGAGKSLQLVRLGSKLLLLMNSTDGTQSIGEITDPHEVEYLISLCGGNKVNRSAVAIRKASKATPATSTTNSDLKQILRQLQRVADSPGNGSVFEA